jgi:hypothetical protein
MFVGTNEYIQIIFVSFETGEYNFIFVGWVRDRRIYESSDLTLTDLIYSLVMWLIFVS